MDRQAPWEDMSTSYAFHNMRSRDEKVVQQISAVANLCHTITVLSYSYTTQMDRQAPWEDMRAYVECVHV
jgi:hypothetical protein